MINELNIKLKYQTAIFAAGCFWGVEYYFKKQKGVISTNVGYIGGTKQNPTYEDVCYKNTGHYEALEVIFNPELVTYEELAKLFFEIHDPTQKNGQGNDIGLQYESAIFYLNNEQLEISIKLINQLKLKGFDIATVLKPAQIFWKAENYHQDYYGKNNGKPYCHRYIKRF